MLLMLSLSACKKKQTVVETPWGTTVDIDGEGVAEDSTANSSADGRYALKDIQQGGEMIMLTLSGPETYYDYHGRGMGLHYLMCEKLADHLGVTLRVDVCKDTAEMIQRLKRGEADIIAFPLDKRDRAGLIPCAAGWAVSKSNGELANAVRSWYKPSLIAETKKQEQFYFTSASVRRHVYPSMLSASKGQISPYDHLFRKYASVAGTDWVMLAAQCYQESCFDPKARSWAGACGLMQIMPATADHLALSQSQLHEPEPNVAAAARYMRELQNTFSDVGNPAERFKFALAAYNGGVLHIRDAMALTKKHGGISQRWDDVKKYVVLLSRAEYYRDPVVKYGYMRGMETANYVDMIMQRHRQYRLALRTGGRVVSAVKATNYDMEDFAIPAGSAASAHRAVRKNKWRKE